MEPIYGTKDRDILNGTASADTIYGFGGNDWLRGHGGNDIIYGGSGSDIIEGGAGDDILFAGSNEGGEDILFGGADSDILVSGSGRDHMNGGSGIDAASWQDSSFGVTASLLTGRAFAGGVEDTFEQIENLIGSRFDDRLFGDAGRNELFGGEGHDKLYGRAGNDHLSGGSGNDWLDGGEGENTLKGGAGFDTADYLSLKGGGVLVSLLTGHAGAYGRFDYLTEIEAVRGSNFADEIVGDKFANRLEGMGGNDRIDGGEGNDILIGGADADTFVFTARDASKFLPATNSGFDRITDFDRLEGDRIDLSNHREATDYATLRAEANQLAGDTHLRLGVDTIVIEDMTISELRSDMFLF